MTLVLMGSSSVFYTSLRLRGQGSDGTQVTNVSMHLYEEQMTPLLMSKLIPLFKLDAFHVLASQRRHFLP